MTEGSTKDHDDDEKKEVDAVESQPTTTTEENPDPIFTKLSIVSPRQKQDPTNGDHTLALPPLRPSEPLQSLRGALIDIIGYAHITRFRFVVEAGDPKTFKTAATTPLPLISPYTGPGAVVALPTVDCLDDYLELGAVLQDSVAFRMVLEPYNAMAVQDHVARLRSLFAGHAPSSTVLYEEHAVVVEDGGGGSDKKNPEETNGNKGDSYKTEPLPALKPPETVAVDVSRLGDYFYLAWGEAPPDSIAKSDGKKKKKPKDEAVRWNELEEATHVNCTILPSGYNPPPVQRQLMGDFSYFDVTFPDESVVCVTACRLGFYVNGTQPSKHFDPAPAQDHYYSHALLDCLLQASESLRDAWSKALEASKERAEISARLAPISNHFYSGVRGDYPGFKTAAMAAETLESSLPSSSWLSPVPRQSQDQPSAWNRHQYHRFSQHLALDDLQATHGVDLRGGGLRDWNDELQTAREMPTSTLNERIDRARLLYKIQQEFAEASLQSIYAIARGHVMPMNPGESHRTHVFLHNNIFVSRGLDAAPDTFKLARGDGAARKVANRDVQCIGVLQRMEQTGIFTLATVLLDYLGIRYCCQSILPGILSGEKSHTLLYGSLEVGSPIKCDEELQKSLEDKVGEGLFVATRPVMTTPLLMADKQKTPDDKNKDAVIATCMPLEAKGILGSDQRRYVLEVGRLTPRDANWIPEADGGTAKMEGMELDDEWALCVLRPELVNQFTQSKLHQRMKQRYAASVEEKESRSSDADQRENLENYETISSEDKPDESKVVKEKNDGTPAGNVNGDLTTVPDSSNPESEQAKEELKKFTEEDNAYLKSLKFNVNALLPYTRPFSHCNGELVQQMKNDEDLIREASVFLWDNVLPRITSTIRESLIPEPPIDGRSLTEFLHRHGVNCRYLGRLATLAREQEDRDDKTAQSLQAGEHTLVDRKVMPKYWLELLECEMIARAAKHILDRYLTENNGASAAQTIASFLSALVSECDESAGQTEIRLNKRASTDPDEEDVAALTIVDVVGFEETEPDTTRNRRDIWKDIESDVMRRFRYKCSLYNSGSKSERVLYTALLRRVCLRSGIKLAASNFELGGNCHCGGIGAANGRLALSYPISPLDVVDVVATMKHSAAYGEGFAPCYLGSNGGISVPPLQVSLKEARATLERAHIHSKSGALGKALELSQEASNYYSRITEQQSHPGVIESCELMASVMLHVGDPINAAVHQGKAIGLIIQNNGIDSHSMVVAHMMMFQMLYTARKLDVAVKHMKAACYLLTMLGGERHIDLYSAYHKLGTVYSHAEYGDKYLDTALAYFQEARKRGSSDRVIDGCLAKSTAKVLEQLGRFKEAIDDEKQAFRTLSLFFGEKHNLALESDANLKRQTKLAVENANKALAEAAKTEILAASQDNGEDDKRKKKQKKKKGKGKPPHGKP